MVGGPTDFGGGSDAILEIVVEPITTPQSQLVSWGLLPHINTCLIMMRKKFPK